MYLSRGAPLADWHREAGPEFAAVESLLIATNALARRWSRPGLPAMRIVDYGDRRVAAVCDDELTPAIDLTRADRVLHRPDESKIRQMVASALSLEVSRDRIAPLPGLLHIGNWQPKPSARFPCLLLAALTPPHLAELVVSALPSQDGHAILFTMTQAMWSARSASVADPRRVAMVPLDDVLEWRGGSWAATAAWDEYLGAFVQNTGIKLPGGFSTLKKKSRVARASGTAGKIKSELRGWYPGAKRHLAEAGELLPRPSLAFLADACGVSVSAVSRWLRGKCKNPDREVVSLWNGMRDESCIRRYREP